MSAYAKTDSAGVTSRNVRLTGAFVVRGTMTRRETQPWGIGGRTTLDDFSAVLWR